MIHKHNERTMLVMNIDTLFTWERAIEQNKEYKERLERVIPEVAEVLTAYYHHLHHKKYERLLWQWHNFFTLENEMANDKLSVMLTRLSSVAKRDISRNSYTFHSVWFKGYAELLAFDCRFRKRNSTNHINIVANIIDNVLASMLKELNDNFLLPRYHKDGFLHHPGKVNEYLGIIHSVFLPSTHEQTEGGNTLTFVANTSLCYSLDAIYREHQLDEQKVTNGIIYERGQLLTALLFSYELIGRTNKKDMLINTVFSKEDAPYLQSLFTNAVIEYDRIVRRIIVDFTNECNEW